MRTDYKQSNIDRRDFRHSHDDTEHIVPSKKKKPKPKKGCSANDGNTHVYEWFKVYYKDGFIFEALEKICVGCEKVHNRRISDIENFVKDVEIFGVKHKEKFAF